MNRVECLGDLVQAAVMAKSKLNDRGVQVAALAVAAAVLLSALADSQSAHADTAVSAAALVQSQDSSLPTPTVIFDDHKSKVVARKFRGKCKKLTKIRDDFYDSKDLSKGKLGSCEPNVR